MVIVSIAICYVYDVSSPWGSPSKVKHWLLELNPIGSSVQAVKTVIKTHKWRQCYEKRFEQSPRSINFFPGVKGTYAIGVDFGQHPGIPFSYGVDAYWGFDSTGKLIDLKVRVIPNGL